MPTELYRITTTTEFLRFMGYYAKADVSGLHIGPSSTAETVPKRRF